MSLARFGAPIPQQLVEAFDRCIQAKGYRTRSEAIRDMIRSYLVEAAREGRTAQVMGTITVGYEDATGNLPQALAGLQHQSHGEIRCCTHVHLDHHRCLEVILVQGQARHVQMIADRLISTRGSSTTSWSAPPPAAPSLEPPRPQREYTPTSSA